MLCSTPLPEKEFFTDNLLVRVPLNIKMIRWTGLAPWEFEFSFPNGLIATFLKLLLLLLRLIKGSWFLVWGLRFRNYSGVIV